MHEFRGDGRIGWEGERFYEVSGLRHRGIWSREWELNPRPADYESAALPLSYLGSVLLFNNLQDARLPFFAHCSGKCLHGRFHLL